MRHRLETFEIEAKAKKSDNDLEGRYWRITDGGILATSELIDDSVHMASKRKEDNDNRSTDN